MFLLCWMIGIRQERGAMVHPLVVWTWGTSLCSKIMILMSTDPRIHLSVVQLDKNRHRSYASWSRVSPSQHSILLDRKNEWKVLPQQKQWESYKLWTSMESDRCIQDKIKERKKEEMHAMFGWCGIILSWPPVVGAFGVASTLGCFSFVWTDMILYMKVADPSDLVSLFLLCCCRRVRAETCHCGHERCVYGC